MQAMSKKCENRWEYNQFRHMLKIFTELPTWKLFQVKLPLISRKHFIHVCQCQVPTSMEDTTTSELTVKSCEASTSTADNQEMEIGSSNETNSYIDCEAELPLNRQKSIQKSFGEIYAYSSTGDKTRKINNAILFMICRQSAFFTGRK